MKKFFTTLALALLTLAASAQENPNRVIVKQKYKAPVGYLAERIDSIYFTKLEGRVAADVKFLSFSKGNLTDTIRLAVTKTPECKSYKIACMPAGQANSFASDAALEQYFDQLEDCPTFTDDFTNATLTGLDMEFQSNGTYSLVTLGYDKYGIACASSRADFTTPNSDLVGDPKVLYTVVEVKPDNFTIWFQPNDDCHGYYLCAFKAGTAEELFEKWSKEEGFVNLQDMIKSWGSDKYTDTQMYKWSGMEPGTDYEVYVLPVDVNEADAPFQIIPITTTESGGEGEATVTIKLGDFGEVGGNYFQYVWFTPNDEATLMRDLVLAKNDVMTQDYWGKGASSLSRSTSRTTTCPTTGTVMVRTTLSGASMPIPTTMPLPLHRMPRESGVRLPHWSSARRPLLLAQHLPSLADRVCVWTRWSICTAISSRARPPMSCRRAERPVSPS